MYLAAQIYPFYQLYQSRNIQPDYKAIFTLLKETGYDGFEGFLDKTDETDAYWEDLEESGLRMRTGYMNLTLHEESHSYQERERALRAAEKYIPRGLTHLVINPVPLDWSDRTLSKNDRQLTIQLENLNRLGKALKENGVVLSYHTHDTEMAGGAKEIFHMLLNSNRDYLSWCYDGDWISRGSGHSPLAMLNWARLFGDRISIVHIRQSTDTVWDDAVGPGDFDYPALAKILGKNKSQPLFINEQIPADPSTAFFGRYDNYRNSADQIREWFQS